VQASEMRFLRRIEGVAFFDKVRIALKFENLWTLSATAYFYESKDLSLDGLVM